MKEGSLTLDELGPYTKNPLIVKVLNELHFVEDLGSGRRNLKRYAPLYYPDYKIEISNGNQFEFSITYDGKVIRLNFPELTEERRRDLVKDIKKMAEESKVAIRSIRRDGIDKAKAMQKNSEITEDDLRGAEDTIQKLTDKKIEEIDKILADKEKEILTV